MKKFARSLIMSVVLLIVAICFSACSTTQLVTVYNSDNTIDEIVGLTLEREDIENAGVNYDEFKQYITTLIDNELNLQILEYNFQNGFEASDHISKISVSWEEDSCTFGLRFKSVAIYRNFYGITESNVTVWQTEEHFFYTKYYQTGSSILGSPKIGAIYERVRGQIEQDYPTLTNLNNTILYSYISDSRREHSDADYVAYINGNYYHTWEIDTNNLAEPITIYYTLANRGAVILVCIGVGLIVFAIIGIIAIVNYKKHKNKKNVDDIKEDNPTELDIEK